LGITHKFLGGANNYLPRWERFFYQVTIERRFLLRKNFVPCLADVFISAVKFMEGAPHQRWWHYTEERKLEKFIELAPPVGEVLEALH